MDTEVVAAIWGAAVGGGLALAGSAIQLISSNFSARRAEKHNRRLAFEQLKRDAYTEVLTWFALVRDTLRISINLKKRWEGEGSELVHRARLDALTELYGSKEFRATLEKFQPAILVVLGNYDRWCDLNEREVSARSKDDAAELQELTVLLGSQVDELGDVIQEIRAVAREEIATDAGAAYA
ncbi:hypothetical protein AB0H43_10550 [Hamadaea sp. NPDC050747]|uniref:hypothetical protein n=1 Tax=Hamadaea sp. NPDC050747 TaxID=3155789 RepID=UPI0033D7BC8A